MSRIKTNINKFIALLIVLGLISSSCFAANGHSVTLTWMPSPSPGVTYSVFKGTIIGGESAIPLMMGIDLNCAGAACTAVDVDVNGGGQYYYTVKACWANQPTLCSGPSNEVPALIPVLPPTGVIVIQSN